MYNYLTFGKTQIVLQKGSVNLVTFLD